MDWHPACHFALFCCCQDHMEHVPSSEVFLLPDSQQAGRMGDMGQFPAPVQDVQIPDANLQNLNSPFPSSTKKKGGYIFWRGLAFLKGFQTSQKMVVGWLVGRFPGLRILSPMTSLPRWPVSTAGFVPVHRGNRPGFATQRCPGFAWLCRFQWPSASTGVTRPRHIGVFVGERRTLIWEAGVHLIKNKLI